MSFMATPDPTHNSLADAPSVIIEQAWWPDIDCDDARSVLRLNGTVTDARLVESLGNATYSINHELRSWAQLQVDLEPAELVDKKSIHLYRRAVYFYAKAELTERYRDFDTTGAGERRAEKLDDAIDESRRIVRWAISDILGRPRLTVEAL